jgi:SSS family solute:Na+ symporter
MLIAAYLIGVVVVSRLFARRMSSLLDFFLAGRTMTAWPVALTFVASWFGAGSTMGSLNAFHDHGLQAAWELMIPSILSCCLITGLLARRVSDQQTLSQPEAIERRYGRLGRLLLSLLILCSVTTFVGSQMVAAGDVAHTVLGVDFTLATVLMSAVVVLYATMGGYFAVVVTDMCQFGLFSLAFIVLGFFAAWKIQSDPVGTWQWLQHPPKTTFWNPMADLPRHLALLAAYLPAWVIAPEMWQRMSSTKNRELAQQSAFRATCCLIVLFSLVMLVGLLSAYWLPGAATGEGKSLNVLVALAYAMPNELLTAVVLVGFMAAVTSTMDSSLNVGSLTLTRDLYQQFLRPQASQRELIYVSRLSTVLVALPALFIALTHRDILTILWMSADIYASTMFFPIVGLLFMKNPGRLSGVLAMILGGLASGLSMAIQNQWLILPAGMAWPSAPYSTLLGLALSGIGFGLGHWLSRRLELTAPRHNQTTPLAEPATSG